MGTRMVRHYDQDERQSDGSMHWDTIRPKLLKAFAKRGARDFPEQELRTVRMPQNPQLTFEQFKDILEEYQIDPELTGYVQIPYNWEKYINHRGCSFGVQSILENGLILGGHGGDKGRIVFFTPLSPFGGDSDEEEPRDDCTFPQKVHYHRHWKRNQDAAYWIKLSRAQDQGLQF